MTQPLRRALILLLVGLLLPCTAALGQAPGGVLKAGAAKRDVTPQEPLPMWGYGARHDALSTGTIDPLFAAAG